MKTLNAMLCSLILAFAPFAAAQTQASKPPAKADPSKPATKAVVELRADPKREACNNQAAERKLAGEARETFMTSCLKR
jgi:psiF repeat